MRHFDVLTYSGTWEMTPGKSALLTSFGGTLSFIQGFASTGQLADAAILGAAGAAGALTVSLLVAAAKKTKPWWQKLWKWFKKIW